MPDAHRSARATAALSLAAALFAGAPALADGAGTIRIVLELPLSSPDGGAQSAADGAAFALAQHGASIGGATIELVPSDHYSADLGYWDSAVVAAHAHAHSADASVAAAIGTYNSGAAFEWIPIVNLEGGGLVTVSPSNTYDGLTRGPDAEGLYPTGVRTYARVVPPDSIQSRAMARWTHDLGHRRVVILGNESDYSSMLAQGFVASARALRIRVLGVEALPWPDDPGYERALGRAMLLVALTRPDAVILTGFDDFIEVVKRLHRTGYRGDLMGGDGVLGDWFVDEVGRAAARNLRATLPGLAPEAVVSTPEGAAWAAAFTGATGLEVGPYAAQGYECARVILGAMDRAHAAGRLLRADGTPDREAIRAEVFDTDLSGGPLGPFSFDESGDTTNESTSGFRVVRGSYRFEAVILP